jgi:hypothetical protein
MHWHIINWNSKQGVIGALRYENAPKSINDFLDMSYEMFGDVLDVDDRTLYMTSMLDLAEEDNDAELLGRRVRTHISNNSKKLNVSWVSCDEDPCSFAVYN